MLVISDRGTLRLLECRKMYVIVALLLLKLYGLNCGDNFPASNESLNTRILTDSNFDLPPFICVDGTAVKLANVCNGLPDCPDSSDELRNLCHHVVCPASFYRCSYGACIEKKRRCDGFQDCVDGSDEVGCDLAEVCTDREHRCLQSNDCIPLDKICNGYVDCPDESDESETLCKDYPCPSYAFRCAYGGCVHQETVCDETRDCLDGSDEETAVCASLDCQKSECEHKSCRDDEFKCGDSGECIPATRVCDGSHHCRDLSDENPGLCANRECQEGFFRCSYGGCVRESLRCNLQANCHDWSDEDESICGISLPEGACRLPPAKPATHYLVTSCKECHPGQVVPELTRLDYVCDLPDSLEGSSSVYCRGNQWSPNPPTCITDEIQEITCLPVDAPGARKACKVLRGPRQGWIACNSSIPIGSHVSLECPEFYERESGSAHTTCLHDGTWSQLPLRCRPICGTRDTSSVAALIIKGWELVPEDALPWHATLFSHEDGQWNFFCGGTLISERAVLTAGHCIWKTDEKTIKIVLAGFSSNFTERTENTQVFGVESIRPQGAYQDHEGNYGSDVAIIIIDRPALINHAVKPVCLDRTRSIDLSKRSGEVGLVAGLGVTENDTPSETLRVTSVRIVSEEECRRTQKRDFRKYITYTSFCAGWLNGSAACNGDSGGGLVLRNPANSSIWEVHGVVSISPRRLDKTICDPDYYTIFTKVSIYIDWILDILSAYPVTGPPGEEELVPNRDFIEL